jgi:hypothetical protein
MGFKNGVLWERPARQELAGDRRQLHNEKLQNYHLFSRISSQGGCKVLIRKVEGKMLLGRPRHKWEDDIK